MLAWSTQFITVKIESAKYILTEMWECDYDRILEVSYLEKICEYF